MRNPWLKLFQAEAGNNRHRYECYWADYFRGMGRCLYLSGCRNGACRLVTRPSNFSTWVLALVRAFASNAKRLCDSTCCSLRFYKTLRILKIRRVFLFKGWGKPSASSTSLAWFCYIIFSQSLRLVSNRPGKELYVLIPTSCG
jgi:hypothetical protein